jgi:hypothetical protein
MASPTAWWSGSDPGIFGIFSMAKSDPTKDPEFQRVLGNLLKAPPKPHSEMKVGKKRKLAEASPRRSSRKKPEKRKQS